MHGSLRPKPCSGGPGLGPQSTVPCEGEFATPRAELASRVSRRVDDCNSVDADTREPRFTMSRRSAKRRIRARAMRQHRALLPAEISGGLIFPDMRLFGGPPDCCQGNSRTSRAGHEHSNRTTDFLRDLAEMPILWLPWRCKCSCSIDCRCQCRWLGRLRCALIAAFRNYCPGQMKCGP